MAKTLKPGDEFTQNGERYKVKALDWKYKTENEADSVLAWRWIKTTQKFSGNAYVIRDIT